MSKKNGARRPLPSHTLRVPSPPLPSLVNLLFNLFFCSPHMGFDGSTEVVMEESGLVLSSLGSFVWLVLGFWQKKLFFENQNLIRTNDHNISRSWQMAYVCVHPRSGVRKEKGAKKFESERMVVDFLGFLCGWCWASDQEFTVILLVGKQTLIKKAFFANRPANQMVGMVIEQDYWWNSQPFG